MAGTEIGSIFVKIGADTKELNSGLKQTEQGLKSVGDNADSASQDLKKLAERALIDSLKDMSNALGGISSTIISFGKDIAGAAMQAENFRIAMTTAFQGNQEAADRMLQWAKDFANATPFDTNEIVDATIKLKAYGMTAEEIPAKMRLIGDMASGMGKTMDQAVEAIADATTGELERLKEFGITKKMLNDEVNGTLVNSKNQITDMNLLMESLSSIMEKRFAGGMEAASKSTAGQISNLKGEFQALKEELGNELLPTINDTVKGLTDLTKWVREIDPEIKKTTLTFAGWTAAIALAGKAIADIAVVLTPVIGAIGGLSAIVVTAGVGLGALANATIEYKKSVVELQKTDLENSAKREAQAVDALRKAFDGATTPQQAFFKAMQEGIEKMLQSEDGLIRIKALLTSSVESEMAQVKEMNDLQKEKGSLETQLANVKSKNKDGDIALLNEQEAKLKAEIADTDRLIKQKREYIKEMREERKTIYEIQKAHKEDKETVKQEKEAVKTVSGIKESEFNKELKRVKNKIEANRQSDQEAIQSLESLRNQYQLTGEESDKVQIEINKHQDNITKAAEKAEKEKEKAQKKTEKEQEKVEKKAEKNVEKQKKLDAETVKLQTETQAQILENEGKAVEAKKELLKIEEEEMRKKGISEIEITKWKTAEIEKIEQEAAAKKKAKDEKDAKEKADNLKDLGNLFVDVTKESGYSKDNTDGMADAMKKTKEEAQEVLKTMIQINNITAAKGGGTASGLGEFSSASDALANLPGSKPYSGGGSGFGLGRGGTEGMGNIPSFATSAGSSSASTAISTTNKTNASIAFNFGDTNITKNMPQNVVDAGKTLASWAMGVQLRGARS